MLTKDIYEMISNNFKEDEHIFVSKFVNHYNYTQIDGCKRIKSKSFKMLINLYKADFIIVHGLINKLVVILLFFQPWLLGKVNWIVWGGDIYFNGNNEINNRDKIIMFMRKKIIEKVKYLSTVTEGDYDFLEKHYRLNCKHFNISYPVIASNVDLYKSIQKSVDKRETVNILVGNSATKTNQHMEALDLISKYKNENIRIYLPLNYGPKDFEQYAHEVINYSKSIFGTKVIPITEIMLGDDYLKFLNTIDIGVFNNNRQQAMGNISQLLMLGKKVFIREDTNMWKHFHDLDCRVYNIKDINYFQSFNDFIFMPKYDRNVNISSLTKRNEIGTKVEQWKYMINQMKKDK